jgi:DNA primase
MEILKKLLDRITVSDVVGLDFDLRPYNGYYKGVEHDSLVIDTKKNIFYWNSMGISGNALDWLMQIKGLTFGESVRFLEKMDKKPESLKYEINDLPNSPIYPKLLETFFELGKSHREMWYKRGYNDETIDHFKLGFSGRCYVIPIVIAGELYNFQCRTPEKKIWSWTRELGSLPFNFDVLKEAQTTIITESPVNAIAMYQYGYNAVAQNTGANAWKNWWNKYFVRVKHIIFAYDNDKAGYKGSERVLKYFSDRATILTWPIEYPDKYDLNDLLKEGKTKQFITGLLLNNCVSYEQYKLTAYLRKQNGRN